MLYCKNGPTLKFKCDAGGCKGFPYIDMGKIEEHVVSSPELNPPVGFKEKVLGKVVSLRNVPKKKATAFVKTICKNMEGFTKQKVRDANLAHKTQLVLAHPSDCEFEKFVSGPSGIANTPTCPSHIANANFLYGKD